MTTTGTTVAVAVTNIGTLNERDAHVKCAVRASLPHEVINVRSTARHLRCHLCGERIPK